MPSMTLTTTAGNAARILAMVEASNFDRLQGESDLDYVRRWIIKQVIVAVRKHEQALAMQEASGSVVNDNNLIT